MYPAKVPDDTKTWSSVDIFLFSNGQRSSPPRKYHLRVEDIHWWDITLNYLARLQYGSSHSTIQMYTLEGRKIEGPLELSDGAIYVAVEPPDIFIPADYEKYLMKASRSWEKSQVRKLNFDKQNVDLENSKQPSEEFSNKTIKQLDILENNTEKLKPPVTQKAKLLSNSIQRQRPIGSPRIAIKNNENTARSRSACAKDFCKRKENYLKRNVNAITKKADKTKSSLENIVKTTRNDDDLNKFGENVNEEKVSLITKTANDISKKKGVFDKNKTSINVKDLLEVIEEVNHKTLNTSYPDGDTGGITDRRLNTQTLPCFTNSDIYEKKVPDTNKMEHDAPSTMYEYKNIQSEILSSIINVVVNETNKTSEETTCEQCLLDKENLKAQKSVRSFHFDVEKNNNSATIKNRDLENKIFEEFSNKDALIIHKDIKNKHTMVVNKGDILNLKLDIEVKRAKRDYDIHKNVQSQTIKADDETQVEIDICLSKASFKEGINEYKGKNALPNICFTQHWERSTQHFDEEDIKAIVLQCACCGSFNVGRTIDINRFLNEEHQTCDCNETLKLLMKKDSETKCPEIVTIRSAHSNLFDKIPHTNNIKPILSVASKHENIIENFEIIKPVCSCTCESKFSESHPLRRTSTKVLSREEQKIGSPYQDMTCPPDFSMFPSEPEPKEIKERFTQTDWCNIVVEARRHDEYYTFHLPPIQVLKYYKFQ